MKQLRKSILILIVIFITGVVLLLAGAPRKINFSKKISSNDIHSLDEITLIDRQTFVLTKANLPKNFKKAELILLDENGYNLTQLELLSRFLIKTISSEAEFLLIEGEGYFRSRFSPKQARKHPLFKSLRRFNYFYISKEGGFYFSDKTFDGVGSSLFKIGNFDSSYFNADFLVKLKNFKLPVRLIRKTNRLIIKKREPVEYPNVILHITGKSRKKTSKSFLLLLETKKTSIPPITNKPKFECDKLQALPNFKKEVPKISTGTQSSCDDLENQQVLYEIEQAITKVNLLISEATVVADQVENTIEDIRTSSENYDQQKEKLFTQRHESETSALLQGIESCQALAQKALADAELLLEDINNTIELLNNILSQNGVLLAQAQNLNACAIPTPSPKPTDQSTPTLSPTPRPPPKPSASMTPTLQPTSTPTPQPTPSSQPTQSPQPTVQPTYERDCSYWEERIWNHTKMIEHTERDLDDYRTEKYFAEQELEYRENEARNSSISSEQAEIMEQIRQDIAFFEQEIAALEFHHSELNRELLELFDELRNCQEGN